MAHLAEDVVVEAGDGVGAARQGEQVQVAATLHSASPVTYEPSRNTHYMTGLTLS